MDFMSELINNGVTKFFSNIANQILGFAFDILSNFLINFSDINKYIDINHFLIYSQAIACALLSVFIVWEVLKAQSGGAFSSNKSVSVLGMKTIFSILAIYMLPHIVIKVLVPINNLIIKVISEVGKTYQVNSDNIIQAIQKMMGQNFTLILGVLVLAIAMLVLGIVSAVRYIDLVLCILIAPFSALSIIGDGEGLSTWFRETIAIVFTQSIHMLILQILMKVMVETQGITMIVLSIGILVVMIKGANVLKAYTHKTGVASGIMSAGSMVAMQSNVLNIKGQLGGL